MSVRSSTSAASMIVKSFVLNFGYVKGVSTKGNIYWYMEAEFVIHNETTRGHIGALE